MTVLTGQIHINYFFGHTIKYYLMYGFCIPVKFWLLTVSKIQTLITFCRLAIVQPDCNLTICCPLQQCCSCYIISLSFAQAFLFVNNSSGKANFSLTCLKCLTFHSFWFWKKVILNYLCNESPLRLIESDAPI